jgi:hypothetical protein
LFIRGAIVLLGMWVVSPGPSAVAPNLARKTLLDGTAQLCPEDDAKGDTAGLKGVQVYAFDAAKVPKVVSLLYTLDTATRAGDEFQGMNTFVTEYPKLIVLVKRSPKLGHAASNGNGDFEITVPRVDSVLLFAEERLEDQPFFFASKVVATKGQTEVRVIIPMCNKRL